MLIFGNCRHKSVGGLGIALPAARPAIARIACQPTATSGPVRDPTGSAGAAIAARSSTPRGPTRSIATWRRDREDCAGRIRIPGWTTLNRAFGVVLDMLLEQSCRTRPSNSCSSIRRSCTPVGGTGGVPLCWKPDSGAAGLLVRRFGTGNLLTNAGQGSGCIPIGAVPPQLSRPDPNSPRNGLCRQRCLQFRARRHLVRPRSNGGLSSP